MTLPGRIAGVYLPWAQALPAHPADDAPKEQPQQSIDRMERSTPAPPKTEPRVAFRPFPVVAAADRADIDRETLLRLAVALDVLSMLTQDLTPDPNLLQRLTERLAAVGRWGGVDDACLEKLLDHAHGAPTAGRALLTQVLSGSADAEPLLATPAGVAQALRDVEAAGRLVVKDATLLLDARAPINLWHA